MKSYETEARERYGNTAAYREHEQKTKKRRFGHESPFKLRFNRHNNI